MVLAYCNEFYVFVLIAFLNVSIPFTDASNQHLICKSVNDIFSDARNENGLKPNGTTRGNVVQGRPGKIGPAGPRGLPGPRGLKGDEGFVDYNNISEIVERKVCEGVSAIASGLKTLQDDINNLKLNIKDQLNCMAYGFPYNGTCYSFPHISTAQNMNRAEAIQTCRDIGAEMAEVNDKTQQIALASFLRFKIPSSLDLLYLWTGMTYDSDSRVIGYRSGREVSLNQLQWWPGYPGNLRYVIFAVRKSSRDGIWDSNEANRHGVICEKKF